MPSRDVGVSDEKDAIVFVDDGCPHADREGMEEAPVDRVQARDQAFCVRHGSL
jgi:nitrite reductase/ring-hydroxylating ferredoxin subunit